MFVTHFAWTHRSGWFQFQVWEQVGCHLSTRRFFKLTHYQRNACREILVNGYEFLLGGKTRFHGGGDLGCNNVPILCKEYTWKSVSIISRS